jgi:flagellar basal-body rod protein FlgF
MDKSLYVSMSGAKETLRAQTANSHNLANASTTGFKADLTAFMGRAVAGPGYESRVYAATTTLGWDHEAGALVSTGRDLDIAVNGRGWIAVQDADGNEAYTRAGDLAVDVNGQLRNGAGRAVLGDGGPITVPPSTATLIAGDGTISIVPVGQGAESMSTVARIKLVNPESTALERGTDGLFRLRAGGVAEADASVRIASGALESSNVNGAAALVNMIELARRFELQIKSIRTAEENARSSATLLRMS